MRHHDRARPKLPHPDEVPGLEAVADALRRAERLTMEGVPFDVCIRNDDEILASTTLASYAQLKRFARGMAELGYMAELLGERGCDVMFVPRGNVRDIFDDGVAPESARTPLA